MKYLKYFIPIWGLVKMSNDNVKEEALTLLFWYHIIWALGVITAIIKLIQSI